MKSKVHRYGWTQFCASFIFAYLFGNDARYQ